MFRRNRNFVQPRPAAPASGDHQLSPAQLRPVDWTAEDDRHQPPVARIPTYVPAASDILPAPTVASPDLQIGAEFTPSSTVEARTLGNHRDRAEAWVKYAQPLCIGMGFVAVIAAVALRDLPLLSFWALLVFGLGYIVTYGLLLPIYWMISPEGVALLQVRGLWGHLRREQKHRHQLERMTHKQHQRMLEDRSRNERR